MRRIFLIVSCAYLLGCSHAESKAPAPEFAVETDPSKLTTIEWIEPSKKLGKINEGQVLQIHFRFKNTGNSPLVIKNVRPSCGCTVANFPKQPIAPGAEGEIIGSFDSKGRSDYQHKEIVVEANTMGSSHHTLHFELEVVKAPATGN